MSVLRPIYTVQLCRMRYVYNKPTTRIVSCKSNLQLAYDFRARHEECRGLLKHVLKPYDNRSHRQFDIVEIVYDFSMTRAACATKIACDNLKQKLYCVNRPLQRHLSGHWNLLWSHGFRKEINGESGMAQWWECSPATDVAEVWILELTPYAHWVYCLVLVPALGFFLLDSPVFLPPQKPTFLKCSSAWKQWMKSHSVVTPLQIPIYFI